jgi:hypothetical protein
MPEDYLPRSRIRASAVAAVPFTRAALALIGCRVGTLGKLRLGHHGSRLFCGSHSRESLGQHIQRDLQLQVIHFADGFLTGSV